MVNPIDPDLNIFTTHNDETTIPVNKVNRKINRPVLNGITSTELANNTLHP